MDAASIAGLIGEAARFRMLTVMLDGKAHSATDLAVAAQVSAQAASAHLGKLTSGDLVSLQRQGRQRLFRLKTPEVAAAVEALGALAQDPSEPEMPGIRFARTCYDHLAGALSIAVRDQLLRRGALQVGAGRFEISRTGDRWLRTLDIDTAELRAQRRRLTTRCLDWTERRPHVGGALGAALLNRFFDRKWLVRIPETRAVRVTHAGEMAFEGILGIRCAALRTTGCVPSRRSII